MNTLNILRSWLVVIVGLTGVLLLMIGASLGAAWISAGVCSWMLQASCWTLVADLLLLAPLALVRGLRLVSATGFIVSAWIYGVTTWIFALLATFHAWGDIGVALGLVMASVGLILTGIFAALLHGQWSGLGGMVLGLALAGGAASLSAFLTSRSQQDLGVASAA
jgi:hypothetical protein